jgi:hypothetical protein
MTDQPHEHDWIQLKYHTITNATKVLGGVGEIGNLFFNFQKHLYLLPKGLKVVNG